MDIMNQLNEIDFSQMPEQYADHLQDLEVDNLIEAWKECQEDIARLKELEELKLQQIKFNAEQTRKPLVNKVNYIEEQLKMVIKNSPDVKSSKTQISKKFISGTVAVKNTQQKIKNPGLKGAEAVKISEFKDYCKEVTDHKFEWGEFKKKLEIKDNNIINTETGEVLNNVLEIEDEPEKVIIK